MNEGWCVMMTMSIDLDVGWRNHPRSPPGALPARGRFELVVLRFCILIFNGWLDLLSHDLKASQCVERSE